MDVKTEELQEADRAIRRLSMALGNPCVEATDAEGLASGVVDEAIRRLQTRAAISAASEIQRGPGRVEIERAIARGYGCWGGGTLMINGELVEALTDEIQRLFNRQLLAVDAWIAQAQDALIATLPPDDYTPERLQEHLAVLETMSGSFVESQRLVINALLALTPGRHLHRAAPRDRRAARTNPAGTAGTT